MAEKLHGMIDNRGEYKVQHAHQNPYPNLNGVASAIMHQLGITSKAKMENRTVQYRTIEQSKIGYFDLKGEF